MGINRHGKGNYEEHLIATMPKGKVYQEGPGRLIHEVSHVHRHTPVKTCERKVKPLKSAF